MSPHLNQNNIYEDPSFGTYGFFAFRFVIGFGLFSYSMCMVIYLFTKETPALTEHYIALILSSIVFFCMIFWSSLHIRYASQTIQKIVLNESNILLGLYFLRKRFFDIKDLKNIEDFKITRLMSQIETFPKDGTGFFIEFKNGQKYRVSPHMQNFAVLKQKLVDIINQKNLIIK